MRQNANSRDLEVLEAVQHLPSLAPLPMQGLAPSVNIWEKGNAWPACWVEPSPGVWSLEAEVPIKWSLAFLKGQDCCLGELDLCQLQVCWLHILPGGEGLVQSSP